MQARNLEGKVEHLSGDLASVTRGLEEEKEARTKAEQKVGIDTYTGAYFVHLVHPRMRHRGDANCQAMMPTTPFTTPFIGPVPACWGASTVGCMVHMHVMLCYVILC